jgi:hypothetical protein
MASSRSTKYKKTLQRNRYRKHRKQTMSDYGQQTGEDIPRKRAGIAIDIWMDLNATPQGEPTTSFSSSLGYSHF